MNSKFVYSGYWHTWSRVLSVKDFVFVELNLTENSDSQWERVKIEIIREHRTARDQKDICVDVLPDEVIEKMKAKLGEELTQKLLNFDYLSSIDWEKYKAACNGGAAFEKIKKQQPKPLSAIDTYQLMPFVFARTTEESQTMYERGVGSGRLEIKDWIVVIAFPDFKVYDARWMEDPGQGKFCLIPDVDISVGEGMTFTTFAEARKAVCLWWINNRKSFLSPEELKEFDNKTFTVQWKEGKRQNIVGRTIEEAAINAGISDIMGYHILRYSDENGQLFDWEMFSSKWVKAYTLPSA